MDTVQHIDNPRFLISDHIALSNVDGDAFCKSKLNPEVEINVHEVW